MSVKPTRQLTDDEILLNKLANMRHAKFRGWYCRLVEHGKREYFCNLCDSMMAAESPKHRMTKRSQSAISNHRDLHLERIPNGITTRELKLVAGRKQWSL